MMENLDEGIWSLDSGQPGANVCLSFGVHGNERSPIDAGHGLRRSLEGGELELRAGKLLLVWANPRASEADQRWSDGGIDLNRCFSAEVLGRAPKLYEEHRARAVVAALEHVESEILVDFHCTVEPGPRFLMQHPAVDEPKHRAVYPLLRAEMLLSDPNLNFGGVSLDEWMSMRDRVGICYETGWKDDPANTATFVLGEMLNVLQGHGMVPGKARTWDEKGLVELEQPILCEGPGFCWSDGVGQNLQALPAGTLLGAYEGGREVKLASDSVLIFPKKKPEMVQQGKPLVYLATAKS